MLTGEHPNANHVGWALPTILFIGAQCPPYIQSLNLNLMIARIAFTPSLHVIFFPSS